MCSAAKKKGGDDEYGNGFYGSEMNATTTPAPMKGKLEVEWIDEDSDEDLLV